MNCADNACDKEAKFSIRWPEYPGVPVQVGCIEHTCGAVKVAREKKYQIEIKELGKDCEHSQ